MFYSYPKKFSFTLVSALALNLALCQAPAAAMDAPLSEMTAEELHSYAEDWGLRGQLNKAIEFYERAAEKGSVAAMFFLTQHYYGLTMHYYGPDKFELYTGENPADFNKVERYCLQGIKSGSHKFYTVLSWIYAEGWEGRPANPVKAETYDRLAKEYEAQPSEYRFMLPVYEPLSDVYAALGRRYSKGSSHQDSRKALEFYKLAAQKGDSYANKRINSLYEKIISNFVDLGHWDKVEKYIVLFAKNGNGAASSSVLWDLINECDWGKAEKVASLFAKNGDTNGYRFIVSRLADKHDWDNTEEVALRGAKNGDTEGLNIIAAKYDALGLRGFLDKDFPKAVHYQAKFIKTPGAEDIKKKPHGLYMNVKGLLIPDYIEVEATSQPVPPCNTQDTTEQWTNALSWLEPIGAEMCWKAGECSQEDSMPTNARKSHKPDGQQYYENFSKTVCSASQFLPEALKEEAFVFMTPKPDVWAHLLRNFKPYDPLNPTSSEEVGIRLYNVCGGTVAFGNENVKLADKMANAHILDGDYSLPALLTHHQNKLKVLEKLKNKTAVPLDDETRKLEWCILTKPARIFGGMGDPKPAFSEALLNTLQKTYGVKERDARDAIAKKMQGAPISPLIDLNIEAEMKNHIDLKIAKREEKIEILQAIVNRLEEVRPQRVARFKKDYPFYEDMFK